MLQVRHLGEASDFRPIAFGDVQAGFPAQPAGTPLCLLAYDCWFDPRLTLRSSDAQVPRSRLFVS